MDEIERAAEISVARGCGFAMLAAMMVFLGLLHEPHLAFLALGLCFVTASAVLLFKAERALDIPYQDTEVWLMIGDAANIAPPLRQTLVANARRDALLRYARYTSALLIASAAGALLT